MYTNDLLCGLPGETLQILQRVTNSVFCLIIRFGKSEHITPVQYYLHYEAVGRLKTFD